MLKLPSPKPEIKVGQKVKIRKLTGAEALELEKMGEAAGWGVGCGWDLGSDMEKLSGQEVTIKTTFDIKPNWFKVVEFGWTWNIAWIETVSFSKSNGNSKCLICGSTGYAGFFSFECDNNSCQNRRK